MRVPLRYGGSHHRYVRDGGMFEWTELSVACPTLPMGGGVEAPLSHCNGMTRVCLQILSPWPWSLLSMDLVATILC